MHSDPNSPVDQDWLRDWHRAFGIALVDVFAGTPWRVERNRSETPLTSASFADQDSPILAAR